MVIKTKPRLPFFFRIIMGYRSLPNKIVCELDILQTRAAKNVAARSTILRLIPEAFKDFR